MDIGEIEEPGEKAGGEATAPVGRNESMCLDIAVAVAVLLLFLREYFELAVQKCRKLMTLAKWVHATTGLSLVPR